MQLLQGKAPCHTLHLSEERADTWRTLPRSSAADIPAAAAAAAASRHALEPPLESPLGVVGVMAPPGAVAAALFPSKTTSSSKNGISSRVLGAGTVPPVFWAWSAVSLASSIARVYGPSGRPLLVIWSLLSQSNIDVPKTSHQMTQRMVLLAKAENKLSRATLGGPALTYVWRPVR